MKLDLKTNTLSVHSNLRAATHIHPVLLMTNTKYTRLPNLLYLRPVRPGILVTPKNDTRVASYELKRVYDENLQFLHKVSGAKQALIQKFVTSINEQ